MVETYSKIQGLWRETDSNINYTDVIELDLSKVEPCLSGPKRPQDRIILKDVADVVKSEIDNKPITTDRLSDGSVLIAAITSCTNTSNPTVMVAAGLVAKKANALGLKSKEWVKTSLAPGSKVVTKYLEESGLLPELEQMGFNIVGYGCTCLLYTSPSPRD